ncbi:hypothetical protein [Streptomyces clavuligerus]|uniref:hypothetical protein n=1 Tax=Streptomyces clavuligerus TaxID=1901 RepID=UPI001F086D6D|nr:hypothetical protein [Streptomyces clavuligerus]
MLKSFYPVIATSRIEESRDFYTRLMGFETTFEADWYISLRRPGPLGTSWALLDHTHPTIPRGTAPRSRGSPAQLRGRGRRRRMGAPGRAARV